MCDGHQRQALSHEDKVDLHAVSCSNMTGDVFHICARDTLVDTRKITTPLQLFVASGLEMHRSSPCEILRRVEVICWVVRGQVLISSSL